jgi:hypothetical protein
LTITYSGLNAPTHTGNHGTHEHGFTA